MVRPAGACEPRRRGVHFFTPLILTNFLPLCAQEPLQAHPQSPDPYDQQVMSDDSDLNEAFDETWFDDDWKSDSNHKQREREHEDDSQRKHDHRRTHKERDGKSRKRGRGESREGRLRQSGLEEPRSRGHALAA